MPDWSAGMPDWSAGTMDDPRLELIFGNRRGYLEPGPQLEIPKAAVNPGDWPTTVNDVHLCGLS